MHRTAVLEPNQYFAVLLFRKANQGPHAKPLVWEAIPLIMTCSRNLPAVGGWAGRVGGVLVVGATGEVIFAVGMTTVVLGAIEVTLLVAVNLTFVTGLALVVD